MRAMSLLFALLFVAVTPSFSKEVSDPLRDFVSSAPDPVFVPKNVNSDVLRIEADIDGDGKNETFLSRVGRANGNLGLMWTIYTPRGDHYACVGGCTFHPKAFFIGKMEGEGRCLVSYAHASAGSGSLIVTHLVGDHLKERVVRMLYPRDNEKDRELYERFFNNQDSPKIETIPLAEIEVTPPVETGPGTAESADKTGS